MEAIKVTINNWSKFNGKETKKTPNWFKVHVGIAASESLFGLSPVAKWVWICLLAQAKKSKNSSFVLNVDWAKSLWIGPKDDLIQILESLKERSLIKTRSQFGVNSEDAPSEIALEREREEEREEEREKSADALPRLAQLWNEEVGEILPKVRGCGKTRLKHVKQRWEEHPHDDYWKEVLNKIKSSEFCIGKNERGWRADFDFFISPETHLKVLEGKYDKFDGRGSRRQLGIVER